MSVAKLSLLLAAVISSSVSATQLWSDTSVTALHGTNYTVGDNKRSVMTFERASGHDWGTTFAFVDRLRHHNDTNHELYGELGFTYNVGAANYGFVKQLYAAGQWEFNSDKYSQFDNVLAGAGLSLDIPGASYFNVTLYRRFNESGGNNNQLTLAWAFPFSMGVTYDGFIDAVDATRAGVAGYNFTSQLKYDVGQHIGFTKGKLFAGVEYVYWHNKFGIDGIIEKNANFLIKWHL
ncbi:MAG: hypothetical protein HRU25_03200 [Psychrobium sp.]|nr:hypothetical protein [Psychrobium sp.]